MILFQIEKDLKVCLYHAILAFGFAIGLRVKDDRKPLFHAKKKHKNNQNFEVKNELLSITIKSRRLWYQTTALRMTFARPRALIVIFTSL